MSGYHEGRQLLARRGLPDWLTSVPMDMIKPILVPVSDSKTVPSSILIAALTIEVGTTIGSVSIPPKLAGVLAEFTENPASQNLPTETTSIGRIDAETWKVQVGDFTGIFDRDALEHKLREALHHSPENQDSLNF